MTSLTFRPATPLDDEALRRLWRETPMPGNVALTFEREPNAFLAASLQGDVHQTLIAVEEGSGRAVASAGRAELMAYVNGAATRLGYLSELRIHPSSRRYRTLFPDGWKHLREMHRRGGVTLYVTTIFADNVAARRLLERNHPGWPIYLPRDRLTTLVASLPRGRGPSAPGGVELRAAVVADLDAVAALLARAHARYQFAPQWTPALLVDAARCRGLAIQDFTLAFAGGRLVACVAVWDQQAFKQTVVQGYSGSMRLARGAWNLVAPLVGRPLLPAPGEPLRHAYLSHLAIEGDDPAVFVPLVRAALRRVHERRYAYVTFTLSERHPLLAVARRTFKHLAYDSILYLVHMGDDAAAAAAVDDRPALLEAAIL